MRLRCKPCCPLLSAAAPAPQRLEVRPSMSDAVPDAPRRDARAGPLSAQACWVTGPRQAQIRPETLAALGADEVRVRTLHSGVSRGTEGLVYRGEVPASEAQRMRAPFQVGDFPWPVKYGYVAVGVVEAGPAALLGRTVFCLHPHQTVFQVPASAVTPLPEGVPAARAVLAANLETAINALWDAAPRLGDRISVVGGGTVGLLLAWLAARLPGTEVQLVDPVAAREPLARALGAHFALPDEARPEADLVLHASGQPAGLATALGLAGFEATVLELSWYGSRSVALPLGEAFHARRLTLRSSQVGQVATAQRARWSHARRLRLALSLLREPLLDRLITHHADFHELPQVLARLSAGDTDTICQRIDYPH